MVNLQAIVIANIMGLVILSMVITNNAWRLKEKSEENRVLIIMIGISIISCIVDPLNFLLDGVPGKAAHWGIVLGNSWLFLMNSVLAAAWLRLLQLHLRLTISKLHIAFIGTLVIGGILVLILNFFVPVVFYVDAANVYARRSLFWIYLVIEGLVMADSLFLYYREKIRGVSLRFFPVGAFLVPAVFGILIQSFMYGVSTIWPFIAVSVSGILNGIQNESLFRDQMTGLFNRVYLYNIRKQLKSSNKTEYTIMMMDMNGFKQINDRYGHGSGDQAIKDTADILRRGVGGQGIVIRYAGDEFVIVFYSQDEDKIRKMIQGIYKEFDDFNASGVRPYKLSTAIGYYKMDLGQQTIDEIMNEVDDRMYEQKRLYYQEHPSENRRKR